jgi:hypothetical protein
MRGHSKKPGLCICNGSMDVVLHRKLGLTCSGSCKACINDGGAGERRILNGNMMCMQGMDFTTDKLRSLVRKWQSLIEAHVDVKTTDNYMLRIFCIAFTKKRPNQIKRTCYAQSSQIRQVRLSQGNALRVF